MRELMTVNSTLQDGKASSRELRDQFEQLKAEHRALLTENKTREDAVRGVTMVLGGLQVLCNSRVAQTVYLYILHQLDFHFALSFGTLCFILSPHSSRWTRRTIKSSNSSAAANSSRHDSIV